MAFSPVSVGLAGERISGVFGEPRPNGCPHKGLDITSSGVPKHFSAGVYGVVSAPLGGDWGTITVEPFENPSVRIQYLHCSQISVGIGQRVTPWTILGMTGMQAPPGSGITGVHLHLQVEAAGQSHACWGSRPFTDPATWQGGKELMDGTFAWSTSGQLDFLRYDFRQTHTFYGTTVGSTQNIVTERVYTDTRNSCQWTITYEWNNSIGGRTQRGVIIHSPAGRCAGSSVCNVDLTCAALASPPFELYMVNANTMSDGNNNLYVRSAFMPVAPTVNIAPVLFRNADHLLPVSAMAAFSADSHSTLRAIMDGLTSSEYWGTSTPETWPD